MGRSLSLFFTFGPRDRQGGVYDPTGAYVRHWIPALARVPNHVVHQPFRMTEVEQADYGCAVVPAAEAAAGGGYPAPLVQVRQPSESFGSSRKHARERKGQGGGEGGRGRGR
eukprot:tig00021012_g17008.t1